jgi:uncharacterized protein
MKPDPIRCELVSWDDVQSLSYDLALQVKASGFKPDLIVAIARGGFVPARLICDFLQIYELASIRVEHYSRGARKKTAARLKVPLPVEVTDQRVLIVDDVCDSGDTYRVAFDYVKGLSPIEVRTAALQHKAGAGFEPDFVARHIRTWRWQIYPWAVTEDVSGFIEEMTNRPDNLGELRQRLFADHGIRLSEERLGEIIRLTQQ